MDLAQLLESVTNFLNDSKIENCGQNMQVLYTICTCITVLAMDLVLVSNLISKRRIAVGVAVLAGVPLYLE